MSDAQASLEQYAEQLGDVGQESARRGAPDGYDIALDTIARLAGTGRTFTAEDVEDATPIRSNAIGAAFGQMSRRREIICVGYRASRRPARHGALVRVWQAKWAA